MASKVSEIVLEKILQPVADLGIEVADVEYQKKNDGMNLTVFITSENGIFINDCENVHKLIDPLLDELDPTNGAAYRLNVSSLGLDRPFKNNRDYERYLNKEIIVKLYTLLDGKKQWEGMLTDINDEGIQILVNNKTLNIKKEQIAVALPQIKF